ncbi:maestro heat-like repeat family member 5 [Sus scrofa]|uniref:maestro heat-like repeat family member 5 n=1 Tax=Sus scrofa TaxID=9823 RepID=UPI000A2B1ACB|nr:maestro heat-like repeat family member 5 [Sus scrofa]
MDRQHSEKPHTSTPTGRLGREKEPGVMFQSFKAGGRTWSSISFPISESVRTQASTKVPQASAHRNRQTHPTTIVLCKSWSSQAALEPREHTTVMEEAYNSAICFKMLRDLTDSDPLHLKHITKKIKSMARGAPNPVLETIHEYFVDNPEISVKHKFRLFHVLETVISSSNALDESWEKTFMQLALENMTKSTELEEAYQDAASNVLLAICRHSWQGVARHLETELLKGVFPHRSLLYVMGILSSNDELLKEGDKACWEEQLAKMAIKSVQFLDREAWSKDLLEALTKPDRTHQEQPPEKAFLFIFYGLVLQAEESGTTVRTHLRSLLETSHQWPKQREGMALTVGLAAARHLDHVWAVLEQFGRSTPIKWSLHSFSPKHPEDLRWKWASSTLLLAYGQMADKASAHVLPWVDSTLSRLVFYFHYSTWDETLKQSFLTAALMLVRALGRNAGAQSYEFSQVPELLECLTLLMEKEPQDSLCTSARQQSLQIISSLCKLRPPLDLERKSRLLSISLHSVLSLPLMEVLEKHTCLFLEPPNIQVWPASGGHSASLHPTWARRPPDLLHVPAQTLYNQTSEALDQMLQSFIVQNPTADELHFLLSHLYVWLASEKAHERQRAVHLCMSLLKFLSHSLYLDPKEDLKRMGQLVGMLGILCQDPDKATQGSSLETVGHLYQLLMRQRAGGASQVRAPAPKHLSQASEDGAPFWSSGDQKAIRYSPQEMELPKEGTFQPSSSQVFKEVMKQLTMAELADLIWTAVNGLGSSSPFRVQAAADMLLAVIQEHGARLETVANLSRAIHLQLCSVRIPQAKQNALQAITLLARNHTPELVAAFLDFSIPLDSHTSLLWKALGAEQPSSHLALAMLLAWLQERPLPTRPSDSRPQPKEKGHLLSMAAMNVLHELLFAREFEKATREAFPELLLVLLTQMHYVLELTLPEEPQPSQEAPGAAMPRAQRSGLRDQGGAWAAPVPDQHTTWPCFRSGTPPSSPGQPAVDTAIASRGTTLQMCLERPLGPPPQECSALQQHPGVLGLGLTGLALEALKSLLSSTGHWQDLALLELQGTWELFATIHTYPQGVGLLARALVQNRCGQVKAVTTQLLPRLQRQEERERKAAVVILTEFLYSPALLEVLPKEAALTVLAQSLRDPCAEVRVLSLQGLGNILFHPEKGSLLRSQLPPFLDGFFQSSEPVVVRLMGTVSDVLHHLGTHGPGAQSLAIATNARAFFDDERDRIRAAAMALFGDLVAAMAGRALSGLRTQVHQSMVPLLLHLKDSCPAVVTQAKLTFYRCSVLLRWRLRHTLFCALAWESGLSAHHFLWTCLMSHSQEEFSIHLAQALSYLHSGHHHIKTWAVLFIDYTICYHPRAVSQMVNDTDTKLLLYTFEDLKNDPEPGIREFATRQSSFLGEVAARRQ